MDLREGRCAHAWTGFSSFGVGLMWTWLMLFCFPDYGAKCNSTADCAELLMDDEALCPPDSAPSDPSVPGNRCQCAPARCVQPLCRFGATRVLLRTGTTTPGDCCDVYECVQPKGNTDKGLGAVLLAIWEITRTKYNLFHSEEVHTPRSRVRNFPLTDPIINPWCWHLCFERKIF